MGTVLVERARPGRERPPGVGERARSWVRRLQSGDEIAHLVTLVFASSIFLVTVLLVFELYANSTLPLHKFGWLFFVTRTWDPVFENFGALPFIYGTVVTSAVALLIAVPLAVGPRKVTARPSGCHVTRTDAVAIAAHSRVWRMPLEGWPRETARGKSRA